MVSSVTVFFFATVKSINCPVRVITLPDTASVYDAALRILMFKNLDLLVITQLGASMISSLPEAFLTLGILMFKYA